MRIALLGAFPFPFPQGSQVYFEGQAHALARAGAEPVMVTYGAQRAARTNIEQWVPPRAFSPSALRSGPSLGKPLADVALLATYLAAHRRCSFDAVLAHNAEAAMIAIAARALIGVPVVYVAHTILRYELSAYAAKRWRASLDRIGRSLDDWIARRADGVIALSENAAALLAPCLHGPIAVIPPGLDPSPPPTPQEQTQVCRRFGLERRHFALYAGNLDAYQGLDLLDAAAARCGDAEFPIVVATHDVRDGSSRHRNLHFVEVASFAEARALHFAADALLLTRTRRGGFPIKLLNYMEAGRPIVAFGHIAPGLEHAESACLLEESAGPGELADALDDLRRDPERAKRIGQAGRHHLLARHAWPELAEQTLALVRSTLVI